MLSQHPCSLGVGSFAFPRHDLPDLALPPHPQVIHSADYPAYPHVLPRLDPTLSQRHTIATTAREYGAKRVVRSLPIRQAAKEVERRSMTLVDDTSTSQTSPKKFQFTIPIREGSDSRFTFVEAAPPTMVLTFPPRPSPPRRKRGRAVTDIDGELSTLYKKKRRLRLFLITSRLSPQFSHPASNIVDRGSSKIAVWAKQRALGRNLLRKAAILNRIRRLPKEEDDYARRLIEQDREQKQLELAKLALLYGSHDSHTRPVVQSAPAIPPIKTLGGHVNPIMNTISAAPSPSPSLSIPTAIEKEEPAIYQSPNDAYSCSLPRAQLPRRSYLPLPPSPLGLSNYDAFDTEDDVSDPYSHLDDDYPEEDQYDHDEDSYDHHRSLSSNTLNSFASTSTTATASSEVLKTPPQTIYSDFSILDPGEPVVGDFDRIDDGADAIWPTTMSAESVRPGSQSDPKSQQEGGHVPASSSPNFQALFAGPVHDTLPRSPNFSATPQALSPNFAAVSIMKEDPPTLVEDYRARGGMERKETEQERDRQKRLMFLRFGS